MSYEQNLSTLLISFPSTLFLWKNKRKNRVLFFVENYYAQQGLLYPQKLWIKNFLFYI